MLNQLLGWMMYFGVVAGVIYVGWNEPLSNRFPSLSQSVNTPAPDTTHKAPPTMRDLPGAEASNWRPNGTSLDRAPYDIKKGKLKYYSDYDHYETGTPTEAGQLPGKLHSGPSTP